MTTRAQLPKLSEHTTYQQQADIICEDLVLRLMYRGMGALTSNVNWQQRWLGSLDAEVSAGEVELFSLCLGASVAATGAEKIQRAKQIADERGVSSQDFLYSLRWMKRHAHDYQLAAYMH